MVFNLKREEEESAAADGSCVLRLPSEGCVFFLPLLLLFPLSKVLGLTVFAALMFELELEAVALGTTPSEYTSTGKPEGCCA